MAKTNGEGIFRKAVALTRLAAGIVGMAQYTNKPRGSAAEGQKLASKVSRQIHESRLNSIVVAKFPISKPRIILSLVLLLASLQGCGGGEGPGPTTIRGEALVLRGDNVAGLRNPITSVLEVYGYDASGQKVVYMEGNDWVLSSGGISRAPNSRIPDFSTYAYESINSSGQFQFTENPRNPSLIIGYDVYVDYLSSSPDETIQPTASAKSYQHVLCLGDSIAAGADTIYQYYFGSDADSYCGLLRSFIGSSGQVQNFSQVGGVLASVTPDLQQYIDERPEVVLIAFGMNDHLEGAAALPTFRATLDDDVNRLQQAGIAVILVGFLQQNVKWVLEDPAETVAYNQAIQAVATSRSVPFIDVYDEFAKAEPASETIDRLTGDFIHHPNNYGQRIYFSLLLPYFITAPVQGSTVEAYVLGTNP